MRKRTSGEIKSNIRLDNKESYVIWGNDKESLVKAAHNFADIQDGGPVVRADRFRDYSNLLPGISSKPGLTRRDYDAFRPEEAVPRKFPEIFYKIEDVYERVGLIKNVIDLMADFACKGIRIVHPSKRVENFYRNWAESVDFKERSERFLNLFYRLGNVVVRKYTSNIDSEAYKQFYMSYADDDELLDEKALLVSTKELPTQYSFINPAFITIIGGPIASFAGKKIYGLTLPASIRSIITSPTNDAERRLVQSLPPEIIKAAKSNLPYILPSDKISVYHYKKDDWQTWAKPMIYSVLQQINALDKMILADIAALDGAISSVRIFKLGNLEHKIVPSGASAQKLHDILQNHTGGGVCEIIWTPDIELIESTTQIHQFLGDDKYEPILNQLYAGLGIPPTLTGTFGAAGTTNNFISLKTLTERLQYGRDMIASFWNQEFVNIQKSMGFRKPATIEFDIMTLANEDAMKSLYIDLLDRNIVSDETIKYIFGINPDIEASRVEREVKNRDKGKMPQKAGPYFSTDIEDSLKKIALQAGVVTPSEVGLELEERKDGEQPQMDKQMESDVELQKISNQAKITQQKRKGVAGSGRPKNSKDKKTRKPKTFRARSKAGIELWAKAAQKKISDIVHPFVLAKADKSNMRQLTEEEASLAEIIKFNVLYHIEPYTEINSDVVVASLQKGNMPTAVYNVYVDWIKEVEKTKGPLTLDDTRHLQASLYSLIKNKNKGD